MTHLDCTFHMRQFQLDPIVGEEDVYFLNLWGEGMALDLPELSMEDLVYVADEIRDAMERTEQERRQYEVDELLYQMPEPAPNRMRFRIDRLSTLQALYQPSERLWQMAFEDNEDASQVHVLMSSLQVEALLNALDNTID
ncbi:MAG: hypothetical protein ACOC6S_02615 [Chloroflexota bacterium]